MFRYTRKTGGIIVIIYTNDLVELTEENEKVYIRTVKSGFPLKEFDAILRNYPRIKLTNFALLKNTLSKESTQPVEIGYWLPNVSIEISKDKMVASLYVYETIESIKENKEKILAQIKDVLAEYNITYGIIDLDLNGLVPGKPYVIAEGTPPIKGEDAIVKFLEIPERKPVIGEGGKADFFEMNFIYEIKEGDWLGEKVLPKPGIDGTNIHGETIPALMGKDVLFKYDKKSAYEVEENGKIVLYAKTSGAAEQRQGIISVNNHLPINGDVGIETGNIKFNGSVSIKGTVMNGYSVIATGDISIEHSEGITGAKLIQSTEGDIYIKGGIFGLNETEIEAGGSIYVKHVNDANLYAKNDIVIGYYSLGSYLVANSILLDERKGKIIGGKAVAKNLIVTAVSGNRLERRTELIIESLNKQKAYELIQDKASLLKTIQEEIIQLTSKKNQIIQHKDRLNDTQRQALEQLQAELEKKQEYSQQIDFEIKELMHNLKNVGKEQIIVKKEAYPGTYIQIGEKSSVISRITQGTFLLEFGELNI